MKNPHCQGLAAMISVFIDTFIVLNLTVFSILTTNSLSSGKDGIMLTQYAFSTVFGSFGDIFIAVCLLFFAFSTILGWHFFGSINVKHFIRQERNGSLFCSGSCVYRCWFYVKGRSGLDTGRLL